LHFDGEESPSKKQLVANGLNFMHTTKSLACTPHIVTILNVCKLGIHEMFIKQCKSLGPFLVVISPCNFFTWQVLKILFICKSQCVENNRIRGEIAHSKAHRSHKYVNNAWSEGSNSSPTLLFIPFPVPPH